jgi:DNA polymerase IV
MVTPAGAGMEGAVSGAPTRRILLVDCDAFFVQVARLQDPEGAGRTPLLLVGGSADGRGVVTSASYACRPFGVRSGMPMGEALRLCPRATVVPVPRRACVERSRAVLAALRELAPVVQAASIDEFYLDLTGTERLLRDEPLEASAERIRTTVLSETQISVSVGGGTNRLVAKLAAGRGKPAGVRVIPPGGEAAFLREFRLADLPGVGPSLLEGLARRGLREVRDVVEAEEEWLIRWFGEGRGRWLHERCRGIDPSPVVAEEERKSISSERTFPRDVPAGSEGDSVLERHLLQLSLSVGEGLRSRGLRARTVTVKLRDADFTTRQGSRTLPRPLESDRILYETARELLGELRQKRRAAARLLGVGVSNLSEEDLPRQLSLLDEEDAREETERDRTLSRLGDELRARFGREALLPGRILEAPRTEDRQRTKPRTAEAGRTDDGAHR